ncbi:MAG: hypothetical protein QM755_19740 [Luteolibacter sp.]
MKPLLHSLLPLLLGLTAAAQDKQTNPFEASSASDQAKPRAGNDCVISYEHILVPPDLLNAWQETHGTPTDATELRRVVQGWVGENKARVEMTGVVTGTVGAMLTNNFSLDLMWPTEFQPAPAAGTWPFPMSFRKRPLGCEFKAAFTRANDQEHFECASLFTELLPGLPFATVPLVEKTRMSDDVISPAFRNLALARLPRPSSSDETPAGPDPFGSPPDPKAPPLDFTPDLDSFGPAFAAGPVRLLGSFDPMPPARVGGTAPLGTGAPEPLPVPANALTRMVFVRGTAATAPTPSFTPSGQYGIAVKMVRVREKVLTPWMLGQDPLKLPSATDEICQQWIEKKDAEVVRRLSATGQSDTKTRIAYTEETSYPTEWEAARLVSRDPANAGKEEFPALSPATPTSPESRDVGCTFEIGWFAGREGGFYQCAFSNVMMAGSAVHHRIHKDGKWEADVSSAKFAMQEMSTNMRLPRGRWTLMGVTGYRSEKGIDDPENRLLVFVRVD